MNGRTNVPGGPGSQQDLAANVGDRVFFGYDQVDLTGEARATLDRQAQWLKQYGNVSVTIEGHSDERGTREYNLALGDRRATATKNYLVARGISPNRVAHAELRQGAPGHRRFGRAGLGTEPARGDAGQLRLWWVGGLRLRAEAILSGTD